METVYGETGVLADEVAGGVRLSLRALIGGVLAGLATQLLLMLLGAAIGLTAFEPSGAVMKGVGIGFSIWLILSLCVSAFLGAWVTSALSRRVDRRSGLLSGFVLWGALTCVGAWMVGGAVGSLMSGAGGLIGSAVSGAAQSPAINRQIDRQIDRQRGAQPTSPSSAERSPTAGADAGERADQAASGAAVGTWGLFLGLLLSLFAALYGGSAAAGSEGDRLARRQLARRPLAPNPTGAGPLPPTSPTPAPV